MISARLLCAGLVLAAAGAGGCRLAGPNGAERRADGPGTPFDLQGFIDGELAAGRTRVVVPPGRYRVTPRHAQHLVFRALSNVEIVADDVELVCTETTRALTIERCANLRLRGLAIDYDPLPFTQGRIVALAPDKRWLEFEILDGYPDKKLEERIEIYDPATGQLRRETAGWAGFTALGGRRYRAEKREGYSFRPGTDTEQLGDVLVTNHAHAPGGSAGHAVVAQACTNLVLEDIDLYASNCFGFLEEGCDGSVYRRCRVDRRSPAADFPARAAPRMRSLNADAFHSKRATKGPALLGCVARFQGDDGVNICGDYHLVMSARGAELRVLAKHRMNIEPGDPVEFLSYDGTRPGDAHAVTVEPDGTITPEETAFLLKQRMDEGLRTNRGNGLGRAYRVTLDRAVPLPMGSIVAAANRVGNGFVVRDCDFGFNRSRGILIKASHGEIVGNRITGVWMSAILVSPEFWWLEAGSARDVRIENNVIRDGRRTAIAVDAAGGDGRVAPAGAHADLVVSGNRIDGGPRPAIHITSTDRLTLRDNRCAPGGTNAVETLNCTFRDMPSDIDAKRRAR